MRKVKYAFASSLDNFIAREDGSVDWLVMEGEHMADMNESFKSFDTVLMGRKTYEFLLAHGMTAYPNMKNYVFSRTMKESPDSFVEIISENAGEFVRKLKNESGKDVWLCGGGTFATALLAEDLIDEIILNVHPVLLGAGIPVFSKVVGQVDLELFDSKIYQKGLVLLSYRVKKRSV